MRILSRRPPTSRILLAGVLVVGVVVPASGPTEALADAGPPASAPGGEGLGCFDLPPHAQAPEVRCARGSSSGIARGDFNGDGFADLAIGVPGEADGAGAVNVIYGSPDGLSTTHHGGRIFRQSTLGVPGDPEPLERFGAALASGDFNGDELSDLAIGVPGEDQGIVHVFFGTTAGLTVFGGQRLFFLRPEGSFRARFGSSLAWGDFNRDGFGDLAVGAPLASLRQSAAQTITAAGLIKVFYGSGDGLRTDNVQVLHQSAAGEDPAEDFGGLATRFDLFGQVMTAADFDRDGATDLVVGMPNDAEVNGGGMIQVIPGSGEGLSQSSNLVLSQDTPGVLQSAEDGDRFGAALAVGDFDGDRHIDLAVGVPGEDFGLDSGPIPDAGLVQVFFGTASGIPASFPRAESFPRGVAATERESGNQFGAALAAGRFDGDSISDLAIGAPLAEPPGTDRRAGLVKVVFGSSAGLDRGRGGLLFFDGLEDLEGFGSSLSAWNFGKDELAPVTCPTCPLIVRTSDLVIGVPGQSVVSAGVRHQDAGRILVLYGSAIREPLTEGQTWNRDSEGVPGSVNAGDRFGAALY